MNLLVLGRDASKLLRVVRKLSLILHKISENTNASVSHDAALFCPSLPYSNASSFTCQSAPSTLAKLMPDCELPSPTTKVFFTDAHTRLPRVYSNTP